MGNLQKQIENFASGGILAEDVFQCISPVLLNVEAGAYPQKLYHELSLDSTVAENQLKNGHQEGFPGLYSSQLGEIFRP